LFFLLAILMAHSSSPSAYAQGIIIDPPIQPAPAPLLTPITIAQHKVDAVIDGPVANVRVTQVFRNDTGRTVEGVYIFPLPGDAAVSDFQMTVDGQVLEGKLLNKDEARRIYEEIVRRQRDPALLEYIGRNLFQTSVFPIPAGASRKLELTYTQVVGQRDGLYEFVYPLRTHQYSSQPVESLSITVELRNQRGLRTIYSPHYAVRIDRGGSGDENSAIVGYEASKVQPEQDFALLFGVDRNAIGLNVLSYKPTGEDGYFVLLASPGLEARPDEVVARDLVLVLDVSGSMQGQKMAQAREAAHYVVDQLHPGDRFNLIAFSTGVRLWQNELQPATEQGLREAHAWISRLEAGGSTDINRALLEGLAQFSDGGRTTRPAYMLFMTDGLPTMGEVEPGRIVNNALNNRPDRTIRLFTFGVGYDVNTDLLDTLSRELGGRTTYVRPEEAIDEKISQFYQGISTPVLVDIALNFGTVAVDELYPYPLPDLFAGDQLVVVGRYRNGGPLTVTLRGMANGQRLTYEYRGRQLATAGGDPFVARLWATRKIGVLLDQVRRSGPLQELVDEIVKLSLQFGIVTPYTSYLVLEPENNMGAAAPASDARLFSLRDRADDEVRESVAAAAAAPASGEGAVAASEARSQLAHAVTVRETTGVRYVNGKTFVRQAQVRGGDGQLHDLWVDTAYSEGMKVETVQFGSTRYFSLLRQPEMAAWLAISPEVVIVVGPSAAIRVTTVQ
jgi:Ca-activated chloride channel family protein